MALCAGKALVAVLLVMLTLISSTLLWVSLAILTGRSLLARLALTLSVWAHISVFRLELVTTFANPHNHPYGDDAFLLATSPRRSYLAVVFAVLLIICTLISFDLLQVSLVIFTGRSSALLSVSLAILMFISFNLL